MKVVVVTLLATLFMQAGLLLWKISADRLPSVGDTPTLVVLKAFLTNKQWQAGWVLTIVGWLLLIKAMDLGEVTVVQPLMALGQVLLVAVAVTYLGEKLLRIEWVGLSLAALGACVLATEANVVDPVGIAWQGFYLFLSVGAVGYGVVILFIVIGHRGEVPLSIAVGLSFGTAAVLTELFTTSLYLHDQELQSFAVLVNPILPAVVFANVAGIVLLQVAFQRGRVAVVVPLNLVVSNGMGVLGGVLVFSESMTAKRLAAITLIVAGTALLHRVGSK